MNETYDRILAVLAGSDNQAADQSLGFALLADPGHQVGPLAGALLKRGTDDAVSYVVRAYHKLDRQYQQHIVGRGVEISAALRLATRDHTVQSRENVIDIIIACNQPQLAYILTVLLHDEIPAIRTKSAQAMRTLAESLDEFFSEEEHCPDGDSDAYTKRMEAVEGLMRYSTALAAALDTFGSHLRTEVVEAAMSLAPYLPEDVWVRMTKPGSRASRAAIELFQRDSKQRFAGFAFRALTSEELGRFVAKLVSVERSSDFIRDWLTFSWYRLDVTCGKHLARIRRFDWIANDVQPLMDMPAEQQIAFVDILMASAVPADEKLRVLGSLLVARQFEVQEHTVAALIKMGSAEAGDVLARAISLENTIEFSAKAARMARRELQGLDCDTPLTDVADKPTRSNDDPDSDQHFKQFWSTFQELDIASCRAAVSRLQRLDGGFFDRIAEKLTSTRADDRAKAVMMVRKLRLTKDFAEYLYRLCDDENSVVRANSVAALASLSTPTAEKKLLEAFDDENRRVQANAIESLEALAPRNLPEVLESKLASPDNRVRANAIKALLKPQYTMALQALSSMLDSPDPLFRQSALWAVTQTAPLHLVAKVNRLAKSDPSPAVKAQAKEAITVMVKCWEDMSKELEEPVGSRS